MPWQEANEQEQIEIMSEGPIVLAGQPGALRGNLHIRSRSSGRVRLRRLALMEKKGARGFEGVKNGFGPTLRLSPGIIRPGHIGPVSISLSLNPHTPPGEYRAEMDLAGKVHEVVMHVTERVDLRISPSMIVLENRPDTTISKRIAVSNLGNVPLTIGNFGAIFLDDDLLICRTLRRAAASVDDELRPLEEYLARILLSGKQVAESSGILRVYNRSGEVVVQPGEIQPVDLDVRIPPGLDRRGRFRGVYALYTANLTFVIVPTAGPALPEDEPPKKPRRRSRAASQKNEEENQP